jgi:hypothetical protein
MNQHWKYIIYSSTFLVLLFGVYYFQVYSVNYSRELIEFEGHLIDDEEFSGFLRCNEKEGFSFTDLHSIGISDMYRVKKSFTREPIYFRVLGKITDEGGVGWGMRGEAWDRNIEIAKVLEIKKGPMNNCEINWPFRIIETKFDEYHRPKPPIDMQRGLRESS